MKAAMQRSVQWHEAVKRPGDGAIERPSRSIVEFVGLPGVGKSFLSRRLDESFRRERIGGAGLVALAEGRLRRSIPHGLGKLWRAGRFVALHAGTTRALVHIVRSDGGGLDRGRLTKLINLLSELERSDRVPAPGMLVGEQGVLQAVWSLEMRADEPVHERLLRECIEWLPNAVVCVEVDWQENVERLRRRKNGRSRFDGLHGEQLDAEARKGARRMHAILGVWAVEVAAARRLDFRNETDADAGIILAWLDETRRVGQAASVGGNADVA